jgi:uncharacterized protein YutE (UPF0331/DUF86 family)/predicted nucleotidyltransferase
MKRIFRILQQYFEKNKETSLAFLFGSFAKRTQRKESDLDVAVYFKNYKFLPFRKKPNKIRELERKVWFELTKLTHKEIDLVCLNEAPAVLISDTLKTGIPLSIKDEKLFWKLYLEKTLEAEDFLEFTKSYLKLQKIAKSLSPEARIALSQRLQFLELEMKEIEKFRRLTFEEYLKEKDKRRNVERWVENIINALIDIGKIILASEKMKIPKTYAETLYYLGKFAKLKENEAIKLAEFARLRNILAHEYLEVLYGNIKHFMEEFPKIYPKILKFARNFI